MYWIYTPAQDEKSHGPDPKGVLAFDHGEHELLVVVAVSLMTCDCHADGIGHRVMVNPTGASESLTIWKSGAECLRRRGVLPRL